VEVMESGMTRPKKTLLGVFGLTPRTPESLAASRATPCENCAFTPCRYRRAPHHSAATPPPPRLLRPTPSTPAPSPSGPASASVFSPGATAASWPASALTERPARISADRWPSTMR
jgi:hypothetical protein